MIGQIILDPQTGEPVNGQGKKLEPSKLTPPQAVLDLFKRVQTDVQTGFMLQNKPFDEFDGYSLLQRAKMDQETFAAFVGIRYLPKHKQWRWVGRKNTARNKVISLLAHIIAGMLYPVVFAQNEQDEEDKVTAEAMRILIEEHLKNADYEVRFFFAVLSALVNPASLVEVEYVQELINIRDRAANGEMTMRQVVDEIMSGLFLHIIPIDEIMFGDFYSGTGDVQRQPSVIRYKRISFDSARGKYAGKYFYEGKDLFDYVEAGKTRCLVPSQEGMTLFDVETSEADQNFVQEITVKYRKDDLEYTFVGGIGMFDYNNVYSIENRIKHRRMVLGRDGSWYTIPLYNIAMSGFEPIDPNGRFLWFKSASFKEFWEDKKITELDRLLVDGINLDVMKPMFLSGVANADEYVIAPGSAAAMPLGAKAEAYNLGPNLVQAYNAIVQAETDMSQSTQDKIMQGTTEKGITATQTNEAKVNARVFLGVFGLMIANLVRQIGYLVMDVVIQHDTIGELDAYSTEDFRVKYRTYLARGKEKGKNVNHRMIFTDEIARKMSPERIEQLEWEMFEKAGGEESDQRIWMINPYRFARTRYSININADQIIMKSSGADKMAKNEAFEKLMDPRVMPFIDPESVVTDFVIDEYSDGNPDKYKRKGDNQELINSMLGQAGAGGTTQIPQTPVSTG